jgi:hypothetical protein
LGNFEDTGLRPTERFAELWEAVPGARQRLGYPIEPEVERNFAKQRFERGEMLWLENPGGRPRIWVVDSYIIDVNGGATWNLYQEDWAPEDVQFYNCEAALANGEIGPIRGFGKLWCERQELIVRLGQPVEYETGSAGNPPFAKVQLFQGGVMLHNPINKDVLVLFNQGDWQRFKE